MKKIFLLLITTFLVLLLFIDKGSFVYINKNADKERELNKDSKENETMHKGVALTLTEASSNNKWFDERLSKIKNIGAELQVVPLVKVNSLTDSIPINDPEIENKLNRLFLKSKQYNLKVSMIKPHIVSPEQGDGFNRGAYNPSDIDMFFYQWKKIILYYAEVSEEHKVPFLSITCETKILTQNEYALYWKEIIKEVKEKYPHVKVTIAFKKSELDRELNYHENRVVSVSQFLDYISLNMYPKVKRKYVNKDKITPNDNLFVKDSEAYGFITTIKKANSYFKKDILITETGSTSRSDTTKDYLSPLLLDSTKPADHVDQDQWTRVVLGALLQIKEIKGIYVWHVSPPFNFLDSSTARTLKTLYSQ